MAEGLEELLDTGSIARLLKQGEAMDTVLKLIAEADVDVTAAKPDGASLLHSFSILGCYEIVKVLWEKGARLTILKTDDSTILHSAVRANDDSQDSDRAKILELFLSSDECGGNSLPIDYKNSKGWTALKLAARRNLEKCVEVLLEKGADPDIADSEQYTALHNAVGNPDVVKLLVMKSRNANARNQDGETVLYMAVERGLVDSALTLLEYGADPNITNKEDIAPLFMAARGGHLELTKALVRKGANVNSVGATQGISALHWAAHKEHEEIAAFLIENGGNIMLQDKEGRTPLSMASPELATKMIALAQKMNPSMVAPQESTPHMSAEEKAMAACCGGNVPALRALVQAGVSIDHRTGNTNSTLLHMAAYCGQLAVVIFLMRLDADWKAVDKDKDTVLHFACMKEVPHGMHEKTLEFLMTTQVSTLKNAQNCRGDTPIVVATRCQYGARVRVLLHFNVDVTIANHKQELPLHRACGSDSNMEALLYFAEKTPNLNVQDADGWTPLMYAAKSQSVVVTKYLLQRGADPNIGQSAGFTPLYLAAQEDNVHVCQLLLEGGANPALVGGPQKLSPLHIAAHKGCKPVCLVLVEHGADIYKEDADGDTPLSLADGAELKQALMLAHAACQALRAPDEATSNEPVADNTTNENVATSNENLVAEEGSVEPSEVKLVRQATNSKESEGLEEKLMEEVQIQSKQISELQSELEELRGDKELLLTRNKCLEEELQKKELSSASQRMAGMTVATSPTDPTHCWWFVNPSEYEVTGEQLNITTYNTGKLFNVFPGSYRCMPAAIKRVRNSGRWGEAIFRTVQREIQFISQLQCPYVVQFLGAFISPTDKECVILTELMTRGSLQTVLHVDKIPLDWNTRLRIVRDVCCGMAFLHSHQVLHRSLIPRNILIGEHFNAKISDFGMYDSKSESGFFTELRSQCTGPQVYMAPEAMEKFEFTATADVYSFGIIMCEAATGQKPFADMQLSAVVLVMKLVMGLRPSFNGGVPKEYQRVAEMCWHADPNLRPTFQSVLAELSKM